VCNILSNLAEVCQVVNKTHLCTNGSGALWGTGVEVVLEQEAGIVHVQVLIRLQTGFQPSNTTEHN